MNKWQFALHRTVSILFPKLLESRKLKLQQKQQRDQKQNPMYNSDIIGLRHSSKGGATRDRSRSMEFDGEASDFRVLNDSNGNLSLLSTALHSSLNSFDLGDEDSSLNNTHTVRGRGTDAPSGIDRVSPSVLEEMEGLGFGHGRFRKDKISVHVDKDHAAQSTANTYTAHKSPKASDLNDCRSCFSFEKSDSGDHDGGDDAGASIIGGHALAALNTMTSIDSVSTTVHRPTSISQYASPNTFSSTNTANLGSNFNSYSSNNGSRSVLSSHLSPNSALSGTSGSVHSQYMSKSIPLTSHMSGLAGSFGANCALNQEQARAYQLQQQENHMLQQQQEVNSRNHERRRASKASVMDEMDFIFTDTGPLNDEDFLLDSEGKKEDSCSTVSETSYSANSSRRVSLEDSGDGLFNFESDIANSVSNSPNRSPRVQKKSPESRGVPIIAQNNNNSSTNSASNANSHYGYSSNIPVPIPGSLSASIPISAPYMGSNMGTSVGKGQSYLMQGGLGLTGSVLSSSHKNDSPSQYFQGSTANPNPPHNRASPIIQPPQPSNPPPLKSSNTFGSIPLASSGATPPVPLAGSSKRRSSDAAMKLLSQWGGIVESENISSHGLNRHDTLVNWHVGACSKRGKRSANEDRFCVIPDFPEALELEAEFLDQKKASGNATRKISKYQRQQALVERCPCFVNIDVSPSESSSSEDIRRRVSSDEYSVTSNMSSFSMQSSLTQVKSNVPKAHMEEVEVVGRVGASKRHLYSHALSAKNEQNLGGISREGYFAVYDGHCGDYAAIHCANNLHLAIARHPTFATDLDLAIHETCVAFDQEIVVSL